MGLEQERAAAQKQLAYLGDVADRHEARIESAEERIEALLDKLPALMAEAIKQGARDAVGDPEFWVAAGRGMRRQARDRAGGFLLGGFGFAARKLMWAGVLALAIYTAFGPAALLKAWKVLWGAEVG